MRNSRTSFGCPANSTSPSPGIAIPKALPCLARHLKYASESYQAAIAWPSLNRGDMEDFAITPRAPISQVGLHRGDDGTGGLSATDGDADRAVGI